MELTHLSLFSGIGGLDLAAEWAGFTTVGQCEFADYPTKVLEKHWPNVPRWRDIRTLTKESFYEQTGRGTVDIISGGFPCQPFSVAGNQKGKEDGRYLWPEMLRVVAELSPRWVIGENVPGIINIAGRTVCEDLEREGYAVTVFNFEAAAVGAPHRRERVFFVAHSEHDGQSAAEVARSTDTGSNASQARQSATVELEGCGCRRAGSYDVADTDRHRQYEQRTREPLHDAKWNSEAQKQSRRSEPYETITGSAAICNAASQGFQNRFSGSVGKPGSFEESKRSDWWEVEPNVGRVANGVPNGVDRLKCLGNAVVPQQAYPIFAAIAEIERLYVV